MTTKDAPLCAIYDQILDRRCGYYAGHGGKHNFQPVVIEARELRRALDEMTKDFAEALDLFDANWCTEHGHSPKPETFERAAELANKLGKKLTFP